MGKLVELLKISSHLPTSYVIMIIVKLFSAIKNEYIMNKNNLAKYFYAHNFRTTIQLFFFSMLLIAKNRFLF